ncbi:methyltransferase domain-containing protein [Streptomyces sp. NPDC007205]|uniref:methyltransferase domain-containing protein n=1 Tax=Streptomyces sp. NPDC007205 TaxID=3154316 RepID=UPI0033EF682B
MTTPPTTAQEHDPSALRNRLVDRLLAAGHIRTTTVEAALRRAPRHACAPEVPVQTAYADDIIPTRHTPDGRICSSVSEPWLQADMLEAARLRPGHRVLEIGSGGYDAALIAELVGPAGEVTTADIDADVTDRSTRFLATTGYDRVRVLASDAEHLPTEAVPEDDFDAVIVTLTAWDLPWINMVAAGGRLVAVLRLHPYVWSIGFTQRDGALISDEPLTVCGFVPVQGAGAWDPHLRAPTSVACPSTRTTTPAPSAPAAAPARRGHRARDVTRTLAHERIGDGDHGEGVYEFAVHGYGPTGHLSATEMTEHVQHRQRNDRAAPCPHITVRLQDGTGPTSAGTGGLHLFHKKHTRIKTDWPVVPRAAALLTDGQGRCLAQQPGPARSPEGAE